MSEYGCTEPVETFDHHDKHEKYTPSGMKISPPFEPPITEVVANKIAEVGREAASCVMMTVLLDPGSVLAEDISILAIRDYGTDTVDYATKVIRTEILGLMPGVPQDQTSINKALGHFGLIVLRNCQSLLNELYPYVAVLIQACLEAKVIHNSERLALDVLLTKARESEIERVSFRAMIGLNES